MAYRDSGAQLLSRILELEANFGGLRPRIEALEASVSRLEVAVAVLPLQRAAAGERGEADAVADEARDKHVAEQVGHLSFRIAALEQKLEVQPPPARGDDDLRALVDAEIGTSKRRAARRR